MTDKLNIKAEWTFTTEPGEAQKRLFARLLREQEKAKELQSEREDIK